MHSKSEPTFLYVEDDPASCKVIEMLLKSGLGYSNLLIFENSLNFRERLDSLSPAPDIVFLDIQVAPHNGYEMLDMLRGMPRFAATTVIALTAGVMSTDVESLRLAGFDGLIGKPILKASFPQLVQQALSGEPVWYVP